MKKLTRREMLGLMGITTAGAFLAACRTATPVAPAKTEEPKKEETAPTQAPAKGDPVVVTFVESWFGVPQFKESIDPVTKAISAQMQAEGLNIEIRSMILDDHGAKYPVLYASGADFTCAFDAPWYKMPSLISQGALQKVEDLIKEYGPSITEVVTQKILDFNYMTDANNEKHLYGIPVGFYYSGTTGPIIREDLRKKYGAPEPSSSGGYASLEPYLKAIKENEPGMIPFANRPAYPMTAGNGWAGARRSKGLGTMLGVPDILQGTEIVEVEKQQWYQDAAALCRSWYEKGYVPQEAISSDYNVLTDYFVVEKTASYQNNEPEYKAYEEGKAMIKAVPEAEVRGFDVSGQRGGRKGLGTLKQWNYVVFNVNAPQAQKVAGIQYFNWLMSSQDNADMWLMGIEGVNYKKEPNMRFSDVEGADPTRNYRRQWYVSGVTGRMQRQPLDLSLECEEALKFYTTESNFVFTPFDAFSVDTKEIETDAAAVTAAYQEASFAIDTGSLPVEQSLPALTAALDAAGRQRIKEWYQKKLDEWVAENKSYIDSFDTGL